MSAALIDPDTGDFMWFELSAYIARTAAILVAVFAVGFAVGYFF